MVSRRHHLFFVLVEQLQHLLRGAVAGEPVDVVADGRIERPQRFVQRFQIGSHLPQHILVGVLLFPHALQQLPGLVQLAGVGDHTGIQDLFQRVQQRGHFRHKGQGRLALVTAGLLFQPAGAAQPQQKAQRQRMGVAGGLFLLIAGTVCVQRQGLCQCRKIILRAGDGLRTGNAVVGRMAALFPQQEQQLRIKRPVRPRQWAEQPWADQFKQLHGTFLSVRIRIRFYCITSGRVCHKKAQKSPGSGCSPGQEDPGLFCGHLSNRRGAALRHRFTPSGAGCTMPGTPCSAPMEGGCAVFFRFRAGTFKNYTVLPFFHAKMRS